MKFKHLLLLILIPLSEIKAIFYNYDKKVSWYIFSNHERMACNVIEDYSNIIIFGVVFYFLAFLNRDRITVQIGLFLFILNALDLFHLGLYDMEGFVIAKLVLTSIIYYCSWFKLKRGY